MVGYSRCRASVKDLFSRLYKGKRRGFLFLFDEIDVNKLFGLGYNKRRKLSVLTNATLVHERRNRWWHPWFVFLESAPQESDGA